MEDPTSEETVLTAVIDVESWTASTYGAIVHNNFIPVRAEVLCKRRIDLVFNGTTSDVYLSLIHI